MARINVPLGNRAYDVEISAGAIDALDRHILPFARGGRLLWITDSNLVAPYRQRIEAQCRAANIEPHFHVIPAGEGSKSWQELERLTDWLLDKGVERKDHIVALGGGVIGDITGFAAAIVKRGCGFVQIPTSLLAQVDSSVGGKTAINNRAGKNLVGAFHQPSFVLIDPLMLSTLPDREMRAGYAEVVKYGLIDDPEFFRWCAENGPQVLDREPAALEHAIAHSIRSKARIVGADERETQDVRALLNLGHTFGHALEAETGFGDALLHGEAVGAGMAMAFRYSARLGLCSDAEARRVTGHLAAIGLPTTLADCGITASGQRLVAHMLHDKKMDGGTLPFLLARGIGQTFMARDVQLEDVAQFLDLSEIRGE
ncbi:MAG: 3-dehydroquinate synthase [Blastomonas sp.]